MFEHRLLAERAPRASRGLRAAWHTISTASSRAGAASTRARSPSCGAGARRATGCGSSSRRSPGSATARWRGIYAIRDADEARAYLAHPAARRAAARGDAAVTAAPGSAEAILGGIDAMKLRSSMTLFAAVADDPAPFEAALRRFFDGEADPETLAPAGRFPRSRSPAPRWVVNTPQRSDDKTRRSHPQKHVLIPFSHSPLFPPPRRAASRSPDPPPGPGVTRWCRCGSRRCSGAS